MEYLKNKLDIVKLQASFIVLYIHKSGNSRVS